jgi:hypothetical protein
LWPVRRPLSRRHPLGLYQRPAHQRDRRHHDAVHLPDDGRNIQPHDPDDARTEPGRNARRTKDGCCGPRDFSSGCSSTTTFASARNAPAAAARAACCPEASREARACPRGQAGGKLDAAPEANLRTDDDYSTLIASRH